MKKSSDNILLLQQHIKKLHTVSGQANLYMCLCSRKDTTDIKRIKKEIEQIKQTVLNIESEMENIELLYSTCRKN